MKRMKLKKRIVMTMILTMKSFSMIIQLSLVSTFFLRGRVHLSKQVLINPSPFLSELFFFCDALFLEKRHTIAIFKIQLFISLNIFFYQEIKFPFIVKLAIFTRREGGGRVKKTFKRTLVLNFLYNYAPINAQS